jgi:predicted aspartyl protease
LDTGGPGLDVSAAFAAKAGIVETSTQSATFAGGRTAPVSNGATAGSLRVGSITVHGMAVGIAPVPPDVDGVLGTAFFERFLTTIDYARGRLILRAKSQSATVESAAAAHGDSVVPMYLVPDHFIFARAHVNDAPEGLFYIDTGGGMVGVDLTKASLDAAHITPVAEHAFSIMGGGGEVRALPFTAKSVTLGHTTVADVPGIYVPTAELRNGTAFTAAGRLSHAFFRHTTLTFDFTAMKLIVAKRASS